MNENPAPASSTPAANAISVARLRTLTFISLGLNGLILLLILIAATHGHHQKKHDFARGGDGRDGCRRCGMMGGPGGFERFHHFHHFGYGGGDGMRGHFGGDMEGGPGGFGPHHHHGWGGGDGDQGGMGAPPENGMAARDPSQITDDIVNHLNGQLSLTEDEKAKIKPIIQADVDQFQKEAATWHQALQKRFEDAKAQIRPLLDADQQKKLDQMPAPGHPPDAATADNPPAGP